VTACAGALEGLLARLAALAEATPGREVCGFAAEGAEGLPELWPVPNVAQDPIHMFQVAPAEVLRTLRRAEQGGRQLLALYHSHPSGGAALSSRDLDELTVDGAPVLPGLELWVVALEGGVVAEIGAYTWTGGTYAARCRRRPPFTV
jgi:proteasome lid subunit RPN8/RPN11